LADGNGIPVVALTTKANAHDLASAFPTVDRLKLGNRRRRPKRLRADKGYDSKAFRKALRERGITPAINHRNYQNRKGQECSWNDASAIRYAPNRWKAERNFACMDQNRRLDFLYERTRGTYETMMTVALIRCYVKILSRCRK
jgi:transposase